MPPVKDPPFKGTDDRIHEPILFYALDEVLEIQVGYIAEYIAELMPLKRLGINEVFVISEYDQRRDTARWHIVMGVGIWVLPSVVFFDLIPRVSVDCEFFTIMDATAVNRVFDILGGEAFKSRHLTVVVMLGVIRLKFHLECIACCRRRKSDNVIDDAVVINLSVSCTCHVLSGRGDTPDLRVLKLTFIHLTSPVGL